MTRNYINEYHAQIQTGEAVVGQWICRIEKTGFVSLHLLPPSSFTPFRCTSQAS